MSLRNTALVYRKELLDTLRDRRTLITSILIPLLLFPLLILGGGALVYFYVSKIQQQTASVMILGEENAPELAKRMRAPRKPGGIESLNEQAGKNQEPERPEPALRFVPAASDYVRQINDKKLRAAVEFPAGLEDKLLNHPEEPQQVKIYYYEGELRSETAAGALQRIVNEYRDELVKARFGARLLSTDLLKPFAFERKNVAEAEKVTGNLLGLMLPYILIILSLTGAMYPAIDLTAGEKERGTMETILASPIARLDLVWGKFLMVLTVSLSTTALSILSFAITVLAGAELLAGRGLNIVVAVSGTAAAAVFFIVMPLSVFFSALLMAIALTARSYREAQSYTAPLIFVVILPAMASFIPGVELNAKLALIPILNVSLAAKEIFGGVYQWKLLGLIFASTGAFAAAAIAFAVRQFHREEVVFRS